MAGESQQEPVTGAPDPSVFTTEAIERAVGGSDKEIDAKFAEIATRLDGIDKATELLHDDFVRFPTEVQKEVGHLKELFDIRLAAEKEIAAIREAYRIELKADSKEQLATALAAAKEAVGAALAAAEKARDQETIRTQLANDKTEKSLKEALAQQQEVFVTTIARLLDGQNETKERLTAIEQRQFAIAESRIDQRAVQTDQRGSNQNWLALAAVLIAFVGILIASGVFK